MHAVPLPDPLDQQAKRAGAANDLTVKKFGAEAGRSRFHESPGAPDHRFTPEVIALLDAASAEADAGLLLSFDQHNWSQTPSESDGQEIAPEQI